MSARATLIALAALFVVVAAPATAQNANQACNFTHKVQEISRVADLPAAIRKYLPMPMADRGQAFGGGDIVPMGQPGSGLLRAGHAETVQGALWFVAFGSSLLRGDDVHFYDVRADKTTQLTLPAAAGGNLCTMFDMAMKNIAP